MHTKRIVKAILGLALWLALWQVGMAAAQEDIRHGPPPESSRLIDGGPMSWDSATPEFPPPFLPSTTYCFAGTLTLSNDGTTPAEYLSSYNFYLGLNFAPDSLSFESAASSPTPVGNPSGRSESR